MTSNAYVALKRLLPPSSLLVGKVTAHHTDDETSTVVLPTQQGVNEYAAGVATGSTIRARGTFVPVGANAFVRDGVIESRAPDENASEIVIGAVVPVPMPLTFNGPIPDQTATVGAAVAVDLTGYWSGGTPPLAYALGAGTLPAGLAIGSGGTLGGTPSAAGLSSGLVVRATDRTGLGADSNAFEVSAVAPATGLWVVVGDNGIMTSPDGVAWASQSVPAGAQQLRSVAFGAGTFVAVSDTRQPNVFVTSPDGVTWSERVAPTAQAGWTTLAYGNGTFVVARRGAGSQLIMTSPDGSNWTPRSHPSFGATVGIYGVHGVAFGAGVFVAVAIDGPPSARIMTSTDGITWTLRTSPSGRNITAVCYSRVLGVFAAIASNGAAMTSSDGVTWQERPASAGAAWCSIAADSVTGAFLAVALDAFQTLSSAVGVSWGMQFPFSLDGSQNTVGHGGSQWCVASAVSGIRTSPDGSTWTTRVASGAWNGLAYRPA